MTQEGRYALWLCLLLLISVCCLGWESIRMSLSLSVCTSPPAMTTSSRDLRDLNGDCGSSIPPHNLLTPGASALLYHRRNLLQEHDDTFTGLLLALLMPLWLGYWCSRPLILCTLHSSSWCGVGFKSPARVSLFNNSIAGHLSKLVACHHV